jgi:inosose dehydratase
MKINIASAPDSWGVWFPDDPKQIPWDRCLDEIAKAGYEWTELGPMGYLPGDHGTLKAELDKRNLKVAGTFMMPHLEDADAWPQTESMLRQIGELLGKLQARYVVIIDDTYSNLWTGELYREKTLDAEGWDRLIATTEKLCRIARDDYGLTGVFHPHAETHVEHPEQVEKFLSETDPGLVSLCLDTGHHAYRFGDPVELMRKHHERIAYLHLKSVDARKRDEVSRGGISFAEAVAQDMFVEPQKGVVDFDAFRDVLEEIDFEGFAIVEQDLYPAPFDKPLPIARRTRNYLREIGMG